MIIINVYYNWDTYNIIIWGVKKCEAKNQQLKALIFNKAKKSTNKSAT